MGGWERGIARSMGKYSGQRAASMGVTQRKDKDIKARSAERNICLLSVSSSLGLVSALSLGLR